MGFCWIRLIINRPISFFLSKSAAKLTIKNKALSQKMLNVSLLHSLPAVHLRAVKMALAICEIFVKFAKIYNTKYLVYG